jgi:dihydropteroate synthase
MSNQRDQANYDTAIKRDTADYADPMAVVKSSLRTSIEKALQAGVPTDNIIVDPGIGFGKKWQQELDLIRGVGEIRELGRPILVGPSRKSFIGMVLGLPVGERVEGTAAVVAISIANGADIVRVHDVRQMVRVARMADAITRRPPPVPGTPGTGSR